jgi:diguanylate cyclase (GGDEF)-like protein
MRSEREQGAAARPDIAGKLFAIGIRHNLWSIAVNLAAATGFALLAWGGYRNIGVWYAAVTAVSLLRLAAHFVLLWPAAREPETSAARRPVLQFVYRLGLIVAIALWAYAALIDMPTLAIEDRYALVIILSALAGGAMGVLAPDLTMGRIYISLALLPACLSLALMARADTVLSGLGVVFYLVMLSGLKSNHQTLRQSLDFAFENAELLAQVKRHADEVEAANADLERRVRERTLTLEEMARADSLTGLLNRRGALDRLKSFSETQGTAGFALLFIDLDRFKAVNDSLGHEAGDHVLKTIAKRFTAALPREAVVCRWGGDEFLAAAPAALSGDFRAYELADAIIAVASTPIRVDDQTAQVGASVGVAHFPGDAADVAELIRAADLAATEAKRTGRSKWVRYDRKLLVQQQRRGEIAHVLRQGRFERSFELHYQPIVSAATGAVVCYEALLRMTHERLGPVSPTEFIPIAEDADQIRELGRWALRQSCRAAARWVSAGAPIGLAINVSVKQILDDDWVDDILSVLVSCRLPPQYLEVEVTESVFDGEWGGLVSDRLRSLSRAGVRVSMDDFGTGYSSLSRLRLLPIDCIKIDRAFIGSADIRDLAIVEAAMLIAKRFGLTVVAEGLETQEQAEKFRALGIDRFQGYLYGVPAAISGGEAAEGRLAAG